MGLDSDLKNTKSVRTDKPNSVWNSPIFVDGFDAFWIFFQGILDRSWYFRTVQGFSKGQARVSNKEPRVFLSTLVFSGGYFYNDLPERQEKKTPGYFYTLWYFCPF